jgi:hypothetical protein
MLKKATFSPAQPWRLFHPPALSLPRQPLRPGTRLVPDKAAASNDLLPYRGGWDDPNCAQCFHPPTHWQIFFTRPTLRLLRNRFPGTCQLPWRGPSDFLYLSWREWPRLPFTARIERAPIHRARSASKKGTQHPVNRLRCPGSQRPWSISRQRKDRLGESPEQRTGVAPGS